MDLIKAERKTVELMPGLELDGFRMPDGSFRMSITSAGVALGYARSWLGRVIARGGTSARALAGEGFSGDLQVAGIHGIGRGEQNIVQTISEDDFKALLRYAVKNGMPRAIQMTSGINVEKPVVIRQKEKKARTSPESVVRGRLQKELGGEIEVATIAGNIDLLTPSQIIEVKQAKSWKGGLGQLLVYGRYYPSHQKRLHLFDSFHSSYLDMVDDHVAPHSILLTWEVATR